MPLPPLQEPKSLMTRIWGQTKACVATVPLALALLVSNALQMASLVFFPFSRRLFRRANREIANAWWGACDLWAEHWWKIDIEITGDNIPAEENAMVISNHQSMADITTLCVIDFAILVGLPIPDHCPDIARWHEAVSARPSAKN